ncbi:ferritin [Veillonella sp. R32]|uniref:ferritin n=1 Tax=Veillonella sp. R32 TaxID=2021312 RepID=UPI0013894665|nr:ferritin [Veillonella sp. R32]KAF1679155.1 ferritin [Veillonella sp. R32]
MNKNIAKALNEQVIFEFNSAYLYLALSLAMADARFKGLSAWLRLQYQEEMDHAFKIIDFLESRNETTTLGDIKAQAVKEDNPLKVAQMVYNHEQVITGKINELYALATEEKDYATVNFLNWFITEQVEEEASARDLVDEFTFAGDSRASQLFVDARLGNRQ